MCTLVLTVNRGLGVCQAQLAGFGDRSDGKVTGVEQGQFKVHHLLTQFGDEHAARICIGCGRFGMRGVDAIV